MTEENNELVKNNTHGKFIIKVAKEDLSNELVSVNQLSQKELSEGWQLVLPMQTKRSNIHNFNILLDNLPCHLWNKLRNNNVNKEYYSTIKDNIYHYTVKKSDTDSLLLSLYREINETLPNRDIVSKLYQELYQTGIRGWIMLKAKSLL